MSAISFLETNPRLTALESIVTLYVDHPQTITLLRDRVLNDSDEQLRQWAQKQLQKMEKHQN